MGPFTIIPVWIIQDLLVLIVAVITVVYIVKREEHPASILLEFVCFIFLYAAVYENFATLVGWYGYGRSLVMLGNVPITVPVFEYLVIYGEPVYNFSGWMLLCGYAAAAILLGRWWFAKSGRKKIIGYLYPPLAMVVSLGILVSPLSRFLLWLIILAAAVQTAIVMLIYGLGRRAVFIASKGLKLDIKEGQ